MINKPITRAYLRSLREQAKDAAVRNDAALALDVIKEIRSNDLLIASPPPPVTYLKTITLQHSGMCQKCGIPIPLGSAALWKAHVGVWHMDCNPEENE